MIDTVRGAIDANVFSECEKSVLYFVNTPGDRERDRIPRSALCRTPKSIGMHFFVPDPCVCIWSNHREPLALRSSCADRCVPTSL